VKTATPTLAAGLVEACEDERLFGIELTPVQRGLLAEVEAGGLLHVWALGRRSGKTMLATLVSLWTCLLRPELREHVRRRERIYAVAVATNARQAGIFVEQARSIVEGSPLLSPLVESVSEEEIRFANRSVLRSQPCTARGARGWPVAALLLDEAGHMLDTDGNQAAEPIYRSLVPSTAQFGDHARVLVASSPFGCDGFFHDLFRRIEGNDLDGAVCAQHSTLDTRPGFATAALEMERQRDPEGFRAEYGAEFVAAGSAFMDPARVAAAAARAGELAPGEVVEPVAAIDLGFVHDSTALAIVGRDRDDRRRLRLVLARRWSPDVGPLGFGPTLDEIVAICRQHGVRSVYTDAFSATAAVEYLGARGLYASVIPTTAQSKSEMFASLKTRVYGGEVELYEHADLLAELARLETVTTPGAATVRIRRLGSSHGDLAVALSLACSRLHGGGGGELLVPVGRVPGVRWRDPVAEALGMLGVATSDARAEFAGLLARGRGTAPSEPYQPPRGRYTDEGYRGA
jgi:hypothetical protein